MEIEFKAKSCTSSAQGYYEVLVSVEVEEYSNILSEIPISDAINHYTIGDIIHDASVEVVLDEMSIDDIKNYLEENGEL